MGRVYGASKKMNSEKSLEKPFSLSAFNLFGILFFAAKPVDGLGMPFATA